MVIGESELVLTMSWRASRGFAGLVRASGRLKIGLWVLIL